MTPRVWIPAPPIWVWQAMFGLWSTLAMLYGIYWLGEVMGRWLDG